MQNGSFAYRSTNGWRRARGARDGSSRSVDASSFVDERDVGDLYTPAPRAHGFTVQFRGVRREHRGPLRGELALRYRILDAETQRTSAELAVHLILDADASFVRIAFAATTVARIIACASCFAAT